MTTFKRQCIISLVGSAVLVAATILPGLADEGHGRKMGGQMHGGHDQGEEEEHSAHYLQHLLKHAKEIGLTPEQIGKLKAMQLDFKRTEARTEADIKIANLELRALVEDEQADLSAIKAKVNQLKYEEGALMLAAIKAKRDGMALLTSEQREKDQAHREKMKSEKEGQRGGGMGGMGRGGMGGMGHGGMGGGGQGGRGGMGGGGHGGKGDGDHAGGEQGGGGHETERAGREEHKH
jgi:Spy/CpxP family protein refolding chaperone